MSTNRHKATQTTGTGNKVARLSQKPPVVDTPEQLRRGRGSAHAIRKPQLQRAIRRNCVECMGGHQSLVEGCPSENCPVYPLRLTGGRKVRKNAIYLAIRAFCVECTGGERGEVERCTAPECLFYPYRFGRARSIREAKINQ